MTPDELVQLRDALCYDKWQRNEEVQAVGSKLNRLLSTALDAATAEKPPMAVIIERLEDSLALIAAFMAANKNPS